MKYIKVFHDSESCQHMHKNFLSKLYSTLGVGERRERGKNYSFWSGDSNLNVTVTSTNHWQHEILGLKLCILM